MPALSHANNASPLLTLPLEIRDEIYSNLLLPQHVYTSSSTPDTYTLHRGNKQPKTYVDTRIYLPARFSPELLQTCRQLRDECLDFHTRRLNSLLPTALLEDKPSEDTSSNKLAARNNTTLDEGMERFHDGDITRVTVEILRVFRGTMGFYVPERKEPSPRFIGLAPLLGRLKKIKFIVWAGFDWWSGASTRPIVNAARTRTKKAILKRMQSDQDDVIEQPSQWEEDDAASQSAPRPNQVTTAINTLLPYLPLVEEVHVDVLWHVMDFWNWDLPEDKLAGIRGWLDSPLCSTTEHKLKKVHRRIVVFHPPDKSKTLLRQVELRQDEEGSVCVQRGTNKVS